MPLVVSDTSPVRALNHLELLGLLRKLFGEILIPPAVSDELKSGSKSLPPVDLNLYPFIHIAGPPLSQSITDIMCFEPELDRGEAEAIALAVQLGIEELLMDEWVSRRAASDLGMRTVGVLGILVRAKERGLVADIRPLIDRLRSEIRFFVADRLYHQVLESVGE